jgi:elongation factor P hydroxylase
LSQFHANALERADAAATGFQAVRLERVFANCFASQWHTVLLGAADEPYYQPATDEQETHQLHYRHDFFASALHEVAHWCIAGKARLQLTDFGYWYAPDGRDVAQQRVFETVEVKPQALEWLFSLACGYRFCVSVDNLGAGAGEYDTGPFKQQVLAQALSWQRAGVPLRAQVFFAALAQEFGSGLKADELELSPARLAG